MAFLEETFNWMMGTEREFRLEFIKDALRYYTLEELSVVKKYINYAEKRKREKPRLNQRNKRSKLQITGQFTGCIAQLTNSTVPVSDTTSVPASAVPIPDSFINAPVSSSDVPVSLPNIPKLANTCSASEVGYWWEKYSKVDILAFDTEQVTLHELDARGKHIQAPGTIAIVNYDGNILYSVIKTFK